MAQTPIASISLDLDDKWAYLKTRGDESWQTFPSYLDVVIPRILDFLSARQLTISFFLVGRDASAAQNHDVLSAIAAAGHEIANHSFHHDPWLHLYSDQEVRDELARAEEHIERATGQRPRGFRGPGFSISQAALRALVERGYDYDATTFPSILNPLARAYFLAKSDLEGEQRLQRKALFGTARDALRPNKPYRWKIDRAELLELPVTTMPLIKVPIHFSYLIYLSRFSSRVARYYFDTALALARITSTQPSLLLHPLDFLGRDDESGLGFFPGMDLESERKLELLQQLFDRLSGRYRVVCMRDHVAEIVRTARLPIYTPQFGQRNGVVIPAKVGC